ncbi:amidophosphoribosyltransferase [Coraliomargarita sinensis]|uniref:Amidophosphoribosyltransferase n=1 Tax=Coraliomargarita sinensis TaxID=2174842 RepID=A0A317ZMK7_9BACT|nr:ComF family protein [Coraliomargarita sinensis]PXA05473.1 amidophosphoribosyltransferase [Coraliomargarita sinensis]
MFGTLGRQLVAPFLEVFFPRSCVGCGDAVEDSAHEHLCRNCSRELFLVAPPNCRVCGYPFHGILAGPQACPHCAELDPVFDEGKTLFLAKGPGRALVHELKYQSGFYILRDIERMARDAQNYLDYLADAVLVPVPLHPDKLRERGYNQSERIADALSRATGGHSPCERLLQRIKYTLTQTRLNREDRHRNVKNAFALVEDAVVIPDQQYILVDDVFTTGSTLNACAEALRKAGAEHIKVATLGHG